MKAILLILTFFSPVSKTFANTQICKAILNKDNLKVAGIQIDLSTFDDVMRMYGNAKVTESGDGGNHSRDICYGTENHDEFILFSSSNGTKGNVDLFTISRADPGNCKITPKLKSPILTKTNLGLSEDLNKVKIRFGNPEHTNDTLVWHCSRKEFDKKLKMDFYNLVIVKIKSKESKIQSISISNTVTN